MLRYLTGGESHGRALVAILEGIPAGLSLSCRDIDGDLRRRQIGYGRGERMKIEKDRAEIISGVRRGRTLGSPIVLMTPATPRSPMRAARFTAIRAICRRTAPKHS